MSTKASIKHTEILSNKHYILKNITFNYQKKDGTQQEKKVEVYEIGNAATVLLYNQQKSTIILTQQFRMPTYINGNESGMLIETCAGKLDKDSPEEAIKREIEEETGYKVAHVKKIFDAYTSPGAVSELLHFFIAPYSADMKVGEGGGLAEEKEDVAVLELPFSEAIAMLHNGQIKDAKTIMLLQYAQLHQLVQTP